MGTLATLTVGLILTSEAFHKGLEAAESKAASSSHSISGALASIGTGIAVAGVAVATAGVVALTKFLGDSVAEAQEAQAGQAQLAAVLKSTGGAAGVTADMVNNLASSLQKTTKFADDEVLAGENMLLTFTNIGKDVFPATTQAMVDLSQAMGQDMKTSAIQLGKALNDPTKGVTALTRVGVTFTDQQKKQIEAMQKAGNVAGAQRIILKELATEFGGSAAAAGKTAAGQMEIFNHALSDIKETVGNAVLPLMARFASKLTDLLSNPAVQAGIDMLVNGISFIGDALLGIFGDIMSGAGVGVIFDDIKESLSSMVPSWVIDLLNTLYNTISTIVNFVVTNWPAISATFTTVFTVVWTIVSTVISTIYTIIKTFVDAVSAFWAANGTQIIAAAQSAWSTVQSVIQAVVGFVSNLVSVFLAAVQQWWAQNGDQIMSAVKTAWDFIQNVIATVTSIISSVVAAFRSAFEGDWRGFGEHLREAWDTLWNAIKSVVETIWPVIKGIVDDAVKAVVGFFTKTDWGQVGKDIISGIANGISSAASWLANAARDAAQAALNAAKGFFGIHSPSTVMMAVGKNMMMGWGLGIQNNANIPATATAQVSSGVISAAPSSSGAGANDNSMMLSLLQSLVSNGQLNEEKLARVMRDAMLQVAR